jgi:hypothetical protein
MGSTSSKRPANGDFYGIPAPTRADVKHQLAGEWAKIRAPLTLRADLLAELGLEAKDHSPDSGMTMIFSSLR